MGEIEKNKKHIPISVGLLLRPQSWSHLKSKPEKMKSIFECPVVDSGLN